MRADSTIAVTQETRERMKKFKRYDRETYDDLINRLLDKQIVMDEVKNKKRIIVTDEG